MKEGGEKGEGKGGGGGCWTDTIKVPIMSGDWNATSHNLNNV